MSNPFDSDKETEHNEHKSVEQFVAGDFSEDGFDPFQDVLKEQEQAQQEREEGGVFTIGSECVKSMDLLHLSESPQVDNMESVLDLDFDTSKQVELFEDENSCPICFEIFCNKPPRIVVDCPKCNKSFCRGCLERIHKDRSNGTCPFCRQRFEWSTVKRNVEKERLVAHFPGYCVTCQRQMSRGELPEHEAKCFPHETACLTATEAISATAPGNTAAPVSTVETHENAWACVQCTFKNHPDLIVCEMCGYSVIPEEEAPPQTTVTSRVTSPTNQFEGPIFVNVQTKLLFRKWKPMYYLLKRNSFELYPCDSSSPRGNASTRGRNRTQPTQTIQLHPLMSFGPIYTVSDVKVTEKSVNGKKRMVRRTSHHKRLYRTQLFGYAEGRSGSPEFGPVLALAMNDVHMLKHLLRRLNTAFANAGTQAIN